MEELACTKWMEMGWTLRVCFAFLGFYSIQMEILRLVDRFNLWLDLFTDSQGYRSDVFFRCGSGRRERWRDAKIWPEKHIWGNLFELNGEMEAGELSSFCFAPAMGCLCMEIILLLKIRWTHHPRLDNKI